MLTRPTIHHNGQTVPTWHGYPQLPGAHPTMPWWRRVAWGDTGVTGWARLDGVSEVATGGVSDERLEALDREHPLPPPPPLCGQVWAIVGQGSEMIVSVEVDGDGIALGPFNQFRSSDWPPAGAVLVAGPGAPWGPA